MNSVEKLDEFILSHNLLSDCPTYTYRFQLKIHIQSHAQTQTLTCVYTLITERAETSNTHRGCFRWPGRREQCRLFTVALGRDGHRYVLSETAIITLSHLFGVVYQKQSGGSVSDRPFTERKRWERQWKLNHCFLCFKAAAEFIIYSRFSYFTVRKWLRSERSVCHAAADDTESEWRVFCERNKELKTAHWSAEQLEVQLKFKIYGSIQGYMISHVKSNTLDMKTWILHLISHLKLQFICDKFTCKYI